MPFDPHRVARRFWSRVAPQDDGCWLWVGGVRANGYGSFAIKTPHGRWTQTTAHRWAYANQVGPVGDELEVDHLCRTRACVRPDHLEAVTVAENRRRRDVKYSPDVPRGHRDLPTIPRIPEPPAVQKRNPLTHCLNGHEYAVTGWVANGSSRTCKACREISFARRSAGGPGRHGTESHCPHGHEYSAENTYHRSRPDGSRSRECKACVRARVERDREKINARRRARRARGR